MRPGLLFAACETGVYISYDDAEHWHSLQLNLPVTSVRDLAIHGSDLAIATHGRAFWILDDISPYRQMDPKVEASNEFFFVPAKAIRIASAEFQGTPLPVDEPKAANPPDGAVLDYYLKAAPSGEVTLDLLDRGAKVIRHYSNRDPVGRPTGPTGVADIWLKPPPPLPAKPGLNRFVWDLRYTDPHGPRVLPGVYQAKLTVAGISYTRPVTVAMDPRSSATPLELTKQFQLAQQADSALRREEALIREMRAMKTRLAMLKTRTTDQAIVSAAATLDSAIDQALQEDAKISTALSTALSITETADRMPPASAYAVYEQGAAQSKALAERWRMLQATQVESLHASVRLVNNPALTR